MAPISDKVTFGQFQKPLDPSCSNRLALEAEQEVTFEVLIELTLGAGKGLVETLYIDPQSFILTQATTGSFPKHQLLEDVFGSKTKTSSSSWA